MTDQPNALVEIVQTSGLEKTKADFILEKFQGYFKLASEWEVKSKSLVVTSEAQTAEMKMAREGRLFLKQKRVEIEKARKDLKEQSLREGKAIDGIANVLKGLIEPLESHLEEQEKFVEIRADRIKEERKAVRAAELESLGLDPSLYALKEMPEEGYKALVAGQRLAIQQREEAEKKAEEERIAREAEQERIRKENERLRAEGEAMERQIAEERAKAEAERKRVAAQQEAELQKERAKAETERKAAKAKADAAAAEQAAKLRKEREEREKLEAELKAKADAEATEKKRVEAEARAAKRAPDKEKLFELANSLESLPLPAVKSDEAKKIVENAKAHLNNYANLIREHAEKL